MKSQTHISRINPYLEELEKTGFTTKPVALGNCTDVMPEFGRWQDVQRLFGIKRGLLYWLVEEGTVKSVSLRRKGNQKGCRLFYLQSLSEYLHRLMDEQSVSNLENSESNSPTITTNNAKQRTSPGGKSRNLSGQVLQTQASDIAPKQSQANESGFLNEKQLLARLSISRRTLGNWKAQGILPFIKIGRRCLYDWTSVREMMLRRQRASQL